MTADAAGSSPTVLQRIADAALAMVADGMILGLGTGRAAEAFIERLGERVRAGLRVRGVPTSVRSDELARRMNIEVVSLDSIDGIDIAFDGADEVTHDLSLTKGLGGALLRERVVAFEADRFVVLVTPEKLVPKLGSRAPIPIEVVPFASASIARHLTEFGGKPVRRVKEGDFPFQTDNQNWILDTRFSPISDPRKIDALIRRIPGVVDNGLFLGMAHMVLVGDDDGVRELRRGG